MPKQKVVIVGAGLAGSLLAVYLVRRGLQVEVYERRPDMRSTGISAGRSINLALSLRGISALKEVGLHKKVLKNAVPMRGRMIHAPDGSTSLLPYGVSDEHVINSISRGELNKILMDAAEEQGARLRFRRRCLGINFEQGNLVLKDETSAKEMRVSADTIFACDGVNSAIRLNMQKRGRFNFSQQFLEHGYKELTIPPGPNGEFQLEPNALHIWPRGTYMLIALPNRDGSFTCTLFLPFQGKPGFDSLRDSGAIRTFFESQFPDALPLLPNLENEFLSNPTGSLVTIKCFPWQIDGRVLLLGDAAHAIVPFYGQGMNCAFEDCQALDEHLDRCGEDWQAVFSEYQRLRKKDADAIADLALENFIEMRDSTAHPQFIRKRQLELRLEKAFPGRFLSKYSRVTFTRMPYSEALQIGRRQDEMLMALCQNITRVEELDLQEALERVEHHLKLLPR